MKRNMMMVAVAVICALVSFDAVAQQTTRRERRLIKEGNVLYGKGEYAAAAKVYMDALKMNPATPETRYNLALSQLRMAAMPGTDEKSRGEMEAAGRQGMSQIAEIGGAKPSLASRANYNLGNVAFNARDYQTAIKYYKQALRFNPDDDTARRNLRIAQKMLQNQDKNKDKNKNQEKQNKQQEKNKEQQEQEKQNQDNRQSQEKKEDQMSGQTAEQIMQAIQNKENATRARINGRGGGNKSEAQRSGRRNW